MKNGVLAFLRNEDGFLLSSEALLIATITIIGLIVGLVAIRDSVVQELGDFGQAIGLLNQSYTYTGVSDLTSMTWGGLFVDTLDYSDAVSSTDANGISVLIPSPTSEPAP
jgi:hypothetical protein